MKQSLAGVLSGFQGLGGDDFRERPVDRLAALGAIQIVRGRDAARESTLCSLGVDLIAFKLGHRASSKPDAEDKLSLVLAWTDPEGKNTWKLRLTAKERDRVAVWAVQEWTVDCCPTCNGSAQIPIQQDTDGAQPMKPCPSCDSTGKRRYSDRERIEALGGDFDKAMSTAHGIIGQAEALAVRAAKQMLERW
jgi:hypothetical protein